MSEKKTDLYELRTEKTRKKYNFESELKAFNVSVEMTLGDKFLIVSNPKTIQEKFD